MISLIYRKHQLLKASIATHQNGSNFDDVDVANRFPKANATLTFVVHLACP